MPVFIDADKHVQLAMDRVVIEWMAIDLRSSGIDLRCEAACTTVLARRSYPASSIRRLARIAAAIAASNGSRA